MSPAVASHKTVGHPKEGNDSTSGDHNRALLRCQWAKDTGDHEGTPTTASPPPKGQITASRPSKTAHRTVRGAGRLRWRSTTWSSAHGWRRYAARHSRTRRATTRRRNHQRSRRCGRHHRANHVRPRRTTTYGHQGTDRRPRVKCALLRRHHHTKSTKPELAPGATFSVLIETVNACSWESCKVTEIRHLVMEGDVTIRHECT